MSSFLDSLRTWTAWLLLAQAGCVPEFQVRTSPGALPLTCPRGVSMCTGAGAEVSGWLPVVGDAAGRTDVAQLLEAPIRGWLAVARLVVRQELPASAGPRAPALVVFLKAAGVMASSPAARARTPNS